VKKNVGTTDQIIRVALGLILIALVFVGPQTQWGWIGVILFATGTMNWCPMYIILRRSTCKAKPTTPPM